MAHTGIAHKVISVILRLGEFVCAVIVLGILSRFCYLISIPQAEADGRIIYAMAVAGIGIVYSFFFCPPFKSLFLGFPFDFILFVMWLVAYCLLQTFLHFTSSILGIYVFHIYIKLEETRRDIKHHAEKLTKGHPQAHGYEQGVEGQNGAANTQSTVPTTTVPTTTV
ncbi:MARVEL domain-containing protein [Fusarium falciforme]|uniref:MARVEL domain-containing protein n=1 Tax=Fusarium falciforme TaxID=195108 RepID=UPI002301D6AB|nr:MARVEL domain-containing protein [Fusarium falciforme]WAO97039.1 MARVEL domain-containing protein [Fusarium falciforme]